MEVSQPSKRLSPKGSFKLSLPSALFCGQCKATSSPPDSPTHAGAASARSLSSSSMTSASASSSSSSRGRDRMAELREIFRHFDRDMDGRVSGRELGEFFASMGGAAQLVVGLQEDDGGDLMLGGV
ncbi:hypothetical protein QOZ80_1BG0084560 [Eleusine coracana subsp. coracana]|nr:hypothetical protein QOZ80_1BG0084560 [Eleusine coracana subsp. coracana]